jgi:3-methyladenine DNA glycosylase AlkD
MRHQEVLHRLESLADLEAVAGMTRFGISSDGTLGISVPTLRKLAREIGTDHALAIELWASGVHEARILAVHDKLAADERFIGFLPLIHKQATDERNFVKKTVNWALRQIGKRNRNLNRAAVATAEDIRKIDSRAARSIASDALRELTSEKIQERLHR